MSGASHDAREAAVGLYHAKHADDIHGQPSAQTATDAVRYGWDAAVAASTPVAIQLLLWCPQCGDRHVDEGEWALKPHHTHACQRCGMVWRPAVVATVGVAFLPGFRNETTAELIERSKILLPREDAHT